MVYSFDIFDTVLTRCIGKPRDVFLLMQKRLEAYEQGTLSRSIIKDFSRKRLIAEYRSRLKIGQQDIKLADIYMEFARQFPVNGNAQILMSEEIKLEQELWRPILPVCNKIKSLYLSGERVIYISDMYLPSSVLIQFLKEQDFPVNQNDVYVSGEISKRKSFGSLYRHVLEKERCQPQDLIHFGDFWFSDVLIPSIMGIRVNGRL